jgi:Cysteine rich repeat
LDAVWLPESITEKGQSEMNTQLRMSYPLILAATLALVVSANAQTEAQKQLEARVAAAVKKLETVCGEDVKKYCSSVTPGEGRVILCLEAHEDKISEKCDAGIFEAAHNLGNAIHRVEEAADICWNDIEKYCVNVPPGGGHVVQCLANKKESIAPACHAIITNFMAGK